MNRVRHGMNTDCACGSVRDCSLRTPTIPTQVSVESMECHRLYQEERLYIAYPAGTAARSRVKPTMASTSNYLALQYDTYDITPARLMIKTCRILEDIW